VSSFRSSRDGGGGGVASGDEIVDSELMDDGEPGADSVSGGVSMSASSRSRLSGERASITEVSWGDRDELLCRFAIDCELSEEAEDSSNVRFGERYIREGLGGLAGTGYDRKERDDDASGRGDTERERGRGTWDGVREAAADKAEGLRVRLVCAFVGLLATTLDAGFFRAGDTGTGAGSSSSSSSSANGVSCTFGSPACGPFKFRIDEKCSQSWYLQGGA
jgi:hypothetical protein